MGHGNPKEIIEGASKGFENENRLGQVWSDHIRLDQVRSGQDARRILSLTLIGVFTVVVLLFVIGVTELPDEL